MPHERPESPRHLGAFAIPRRAFALRHPNAIADPLTSLWQAASAFRLITVAYAVMIQMTAVHHYIRPGASWTLIALEMVWSGMACVIPVFLVQHRLKFVLADQVVSAALMLATRWVAPESWWDHNQSLPTTIWVCNAILTAALVGGVPWGFVSGLVMALISLWVGGDWSWMVHSPTIPVLVSVGISVGAASRAVARSAQQLALAYEMRARMSERERLARQVHDGALQVLALMAREGQHGDEHMQQIAKMAAQQERALRDLIADRDEDDATTHAYLAAAATPVSADESVTPDEVDLRLALLALADETTHVAAGTQPVLLDGPRASELLAAVQQALANTRVHAPGASAFILLEDVDGQITVTVRDDGPGIADGRLGEAKADGHIGISSSIVGRMQDLGGQVNLETAPGEGVEWELMIDR